MVTCLTSSKHLRATKCSFSSENQQEESSSPCFTHSSKWTRSIRIPFVCPFYFDIQPSWPVGNQVRFDTLLDYQGRNSFSVEFLYLEVQFNASAARIRILTRVYSRRKEYPILSMTFVFMLPEMRWWREHFESVFNSTWHSKPIIVSGSCYCSSRALVVIICLFKCIRCLVNCFSWKCLSDTEFRDW